MKKLISLIIIILTLICINQNVYANSALKIYTVDAVVTNKDGALCYHNGVESGDKIDYGTRISVLFVENGSICESGYFCLAEGRT